MNASVLSTTEKLNEPPRDEFERATMELAESWRRESEELRKAPVRERRAKRKKKNRKRDERTARPAKKRKIDRAMKKSKHNKRLPFVCHAWALADPDVPELDVVAHGSLDPSAAWSDSTTSAAAQKAIRSDPKFGMLYAILRFARYFAAVKAEIDEDVERRESILSQPVSSEATELVRIVEPTRSSVSVAKPPEPRWLSTDRPCFELVSEPFAEDERKLFPVDRSSSFEPAVPSETAETIVERIPSPPLLVEPTLVRQPVPPPTAEGPLPILYNPWQPGKPIAVPPLATQPRVQIPTSGPLNHESRQNRWWLHSKQSGFQTLDTERFT